MKKYIMTSNTYFANTSYNFYGIALIIEERGQIEVLEEYNCLTENEAYLRYLVKLCNDLNLPQADFQSIVEDFIVSKAKNLK